MIIANGFTELIIEIESNDDLKEPKIVIVIGDAIKGALTRINKKEAIKVRDYLTKYIEGETSEN